MKKLTEAEFNEQVFVHRPLFEAAGTLPRELHKVIISIKKEGLRRGKDEILAVKAGEAEILPYPHPYVLIFAKPLSPSPVGKDYTFGSFVPKEKIFIVTILKKDETLFQAYQREIDICKDEDKDWYERMVELDDNGLISVGHTDINTIWTPIVPRSSTDDVKSTQLTESKIKNFIKKIKKRFTNR